VPQNGRSDVDLVPAELSFRVSVLGMRHMQRKSSHWTCEVTCHGRAEPSHRDVDPRSAFTAYILDGNRPSCRRNDALERFDAPVGRSDLIAPASFFGTKSIRSPAASPSCLRTSRGIIIRPFDPTVADAIPPIVALLTSRWAGPYIDARLAPCDRAEVRQPPVRSRRLIAHRL
jgi:hypothetical protein